MKQRVASLPVAAPKKPTTRKKAQAERWRLYRTLTASTSYTIPYSSDTSTPYADTYRKAYAMLTDELLCLNSSEAKSGVRLRTQEKTIHKSATQFVAIVKLFVYLNA